MEQNQTLLFDHHRDTGVDVELMLHVDVFPTINIREQVKCHNGHFLHFVLSLEIMFRLIRLKYLKKKMILNIVIISSNKYWFSSLVVLINDENLTFFNILKREGLFLFLKERVISVTIAAEKSLYDCHLYWHTTSYISKIFFGDLKYCTENITTMHPYIPP